MICHMMAAVDGRIDVRGWSLGAEARKQYELVHASYEADGWMCGRVTMEPFAKRVRPQAEVARACRSKSGVRSGMLTVSIRAY